MYFYYIQEFLTYPWLLLNNLRCSPIVSLTDQIFAYNPFCLDITVMWRPVGVWLACLSIVG
jgi:hypothetical protein